VPLVHHVLSSYDHEVIVVDESSEPTHLTNAKVIRQKSHGLGNAFIEGLRESKGEIVVLMDGDGSHRPQDILKLLNALKSSDFVFGSKLVEGGKTLDPESRQFITKMTTKFASSVLGLDIKDNMSGFSAMKREAISRIHLNPIGYKINLEAAYKLKQKGFLIGEAPITFLKRQAGKSKVGFNIKGLREVFNIFRLVLELKLGVR
jgi:glycosyltransferase involved in cell wall biosynthesis